MSILTNTLGIFINPDKAWQVIRGEQQTFGKVFLSYVPFLALIPCVAAYYGVTQVGWTIGSGSLNKLTADSALWLCFFAYGAQLIAVFVLGEYINWMSQNFGVEDSAQQRHYEGTAMAVFASMPMMLAGVVLVYPQLWVVASVYIVAACYSVYLIYEGIPILMNIPKERGFIYASSVVTIALVLTVVIMVATVIIWGAGVGPVYTS